MSLITAICLRFRSQGSAKLEKAEILQMTVEHLKMLHQGKLEGKGAPSGDIQFPESQCFDYRSLGFRECAAEVARYLTSVEGLDMRDPLRIRLMQHLQAYFAQREALAAAQVAAQAVIHPGSSWHQARGAGSLHSTPSYAMGAITRGTPVLPGVPSHGATSLYPYFQPGASPVGSSLKSEGNPSLLTSSGGHTIPSHSSTPSVSVSQPFKLAELPYMSATFPQGAGQPSGSAATVKSPYMGWGGELVF